MLSAVPIIKVLVEFATPRNEAQTPREFIPVTSANELLPNSARVFKVGKEPVIVVHTDKGQFKAFGARCTHLGCVVQYDTEVPRFICNCHGSEFDINGKNIGGPAPRPLTPFKVVMKDSSVNVAKI